jgi:hypothetical protein
MKPKRVLRTLIPKTAYTIVLNYSDRACVAFSEASFFRMNTKLKSSLLRTHYIIRHDVIQTIHPTYPMHAILCIVHLSRDVYNMCSIARKSQSYPHGAISGSNIYNKLVSRLDARKKDDLSV